MPRIPEPEIDRIKSSTDLAALVRSRGIELRKHGNGHMIGTCPFHDDDEPSFIVTPAKGLFHCMGCGAAGNPIQFVEKFDGVSFRHAFELLNEGKAAFTKPREGVSKRCTAHRLKPSVTLDQNDTELMEQTVSFYHERLLSSSGEPARKYLEKRGLYDPEAIRHFKIGYSDRTFGFHIPSRDKQEGREIRIRLQNTGLFRKSGHEHFNGCLVMPIFDPVTGNVLEMYGRKINRHQTKGTPMHLYLPGPHAGIWNTETIFPQPSTRNKEPRTNHEVILCEAPLDALTLWVNGFKNVTFIYGTEGFPDYMLQTFIKNRIKTIRLAYDSDNAGNRAAERDAKRLTAHGIETFRVKLPWGMDINKYAVTVTPAAKSLRVAIDSAEWLGPDIAHTRPPVINNKSLAANNLTANQKTTSRNPAQKKMILSPMILSNSPEPTPTLLRQGDYHTISFGKREYRIGGLDKNNSLEVLKVAVRIRHGEDFHLDSFDMTRDNERRRFIERSSEETGLEKELIKRDLGRLLLALEETQQERITAALGKDENGKRKAEMTSAEKSEAMAFLKSPDLADRITETFDACGLAGEESNRLAAYLACTSRKLDKPLAVIIQSTSAAGKSTLMEAVLSMFPEEEQIKYSAMTGQSLYYLGETDLKHRILAIVEEEGAEKASYALKLLQSEGELTIASTGKDPRSGRMETQEYHVEGPVMIFLTTTAIEIDEELQNRCLTLTVDESREQTKRIHTLQRQARTLDGLRLKKQRQKTLTLLRNVQRLLVPVDVVNPYADQLTFTAERTRTRRDHEKYLTLIDSIALLHQHQRKTETLSATGGSACGGKTENQEQRTTNQEPPCYITVTLDDIKLANQLAPELLGRSLDELSPQTRNLLEHAKTIVRERMAEEETEQQFIFFSRRDIRERLGWSVTQVRIHLERLRSFEYIESRSGRPGSAFQYCLLTDCNEPGKTSQVGLLDIEKLQLRHKPDGKNRHLAGGGKKQPVRVKTL